MLVECDQVAVPLVLWKLVLTGDVDAKQQVRSVLQGMVLYTHALSLDPTIIYTLLTLREVSAALGDRMTLLIAFD